MANKERVDVEYRLDDKASGGVKKLKKGFSSLINPITLGAAAIAGLGVSIGKMIGLSETQRKVMAQTEAVIKSTGGAAGLTAQEIAKMSSAFQKSTNFGDEVIQSGQNILLTFTNIGKDVFPKTTQTMLDMSAALGGDLKGAAIQLGKALNDPIAGVSALSEVGVSFTQEQKDQIAVLTESGKVMEAQTLILDELGREFGGSAAAVVDPFTQMKNALGDVGEVVGSFLAPFLAEAATLVTKLAYAFQDLTANINVSGVVVGFRKGMATLETDLRIKVEIIKNLIANPFKWETYKEIFKNFGNNIGSFVEALKKLMTGGLGAIRDFWEKNNDEIADSHLTLEERISKIREEGAKKVQDITDKARADELKSANKLADQVAMIEASKTQKVQDENKRRLEESSRVTSDIVKNYELEATRKRELGLTTLNEEIQNLETFLAKESFTSKQRESLQSNLFKLKTQQAKKELEMQRMLFSEEQRWAEERARLKRDGLTLEMELSKQVLDSARIAGAEKLSLEKQVANGVLDLVKKQIIAKVDAISVELAQVGTALLVSSFGLNPSGWAHLAGAAALSSGIRSAMSGIQLAEGGIVMPQAGGVQATIAEAGQAEAVIPLDKLEKMISELAGSNGGGRDVIILADDGSTLAKAIYRKQTEMLRTGAIGARR